MAGKEKPVALQTEVLAANISTTNILPLVFPTMLSMPVVGGSCEDIRPENTIAD